MEKDPSVFREIAGDDPFEPIERSRMPFLLSGQRFRFGEETCGGSGCVCKRVSATCRDTLFRSADATVFRDATGCRVVGFGEQEDGYGALPRRGNSRERWVTSFVIESVVGCVRRRELGCLQSVRSCCSDRRKEWFVRSFADK